MHGCKEGQCASCKSFVLDGEDIELDSYSTFALPDFEREEGQTLLCRAHPYEDLVIELLNYDEEMIRSGLPLRQGTVEVIGNDPVTHDMRHLVVKLIEPEEIKFFPGQYLDFQVPGHRRDPFVLDGEHAEPGGHLRVRHPGLPGRPVLGLPGRRAEGGRPAERGGAVRGLPVPGEQPNDLLFLGGGAGMAPLLALLRSMAERSLDRKVTFYYGRADATRPVLRGGDREAAEQLPGLTFVPALSEPSEDDGWDGETGLITDVVERRESRPAERGRLRLRSAPDGRGGDRHC